MTEPTVMIGAGLAAVTAAQTLRDEGYDGPIRLVGREAHQPYLRPPLSKGLLLGEEDEESRSASTLAAEVTGSDR